MAAELIQQATVVLAMQQLRTAIDSNDLVQLRSAIATAETENLVAAELIKEVKAALGSLVFGKNCKASRVSPGRALASAELTRWMLTQGSNTQRVTRFLRYLDPLVDVFFVAEHFNEGVVLMGERLGWSLDELVAVPAHVVHRGTVPVVKVQASDLEGKFSEYFAQGRLVDHMLWEHATERFTREWDAAGERVKVRLAGVRQAIAKVQEECSANKEMNQNKTQRAMKCAPCSTCMSVTGVDSYVDGRVAYTHKKKLVLSDQSSLRDELACSKLREPGAQNIGGRNFLRRRERVKPTRRRRGPGREVREEPK